MKMYTSIHCGPICKCVTKMSCIKTQKYRQHFLSTFPATLLHIPSVVAGITFLCCTLTQHVVNEFIRAEAGRGYRDTGYLYRDTGYFGEKKYGIRDI